MFGDEAIELIQDAVNVPRNHGTRSLGRISILGIRADLAHINVDSPRLTQHGGNPVFIVCFSVFPFIANYRRVKLVPKAETNKWDKLQTVLANCERELCDGRETAHDVLSSNQER